ncbi:MAG: DUF2860 domain-containing protein [Desulfobacteraceae bacterium]|nr:DUF2860 domain-containing protein [Desulfobacteraceae bacterium]
MNRVFALPITIAASLFALAFTFTLAHAQDGQEEERGGIFGTIMVGGMYQTGKPGLLSTDNSDRKTLTSLGDSDKSDDGFQAMVMGEIGYRFDETGTEVSMGFMDGMPGLTLAQEVDGLGLFSLSGGWGREDVWKDPYVTGKARRKTDMDVMEFSVAWEDIMETPFMVGYTFTNIDVDKDLAGIRHKDLRRDGNVHTLELGSPLFMGEQNSVFANLACAIGDMDGRSNSYTGWNLGFTHMLDMEGWSLETTVAAGRRDYDEKHPDFNRTRDEKEYTIGTEYTLYRPFGMENYFVSVFAFHTRVDANINFFDSDDTTTGMAIGYSF